MAGNGSGVVRADEEFVDLRPLLFSIAYRMLGSITEAEDVVQDAFLRGRRGRLREELPGGHGDATRDRPPPPREDPA